MGVQGGLTAGEGERLEVIAERVDRLRAFLGATRTPALEAAPLEWLAFLAEMKGIVGNASNDLGFVTTLLAHRYLQRTLPMASMDAAGKAQGAAGRGSRAQVLLRRGPGGVPLGPSGLRVPHPGGAGGAAVDR